MNFDLGGRRTGKTERACEWVRERPTYGLLVVHNMQEAQRLIETEELKKDQVITYEQVRRGALAGRHAHLWVDNADILLQQFFNPLVVHGVSATVDEVHVTSFDHAFGLTKT